jgi:outer membrane protein assembly factor BamB
VNDEHVSPAYASSPAIVDSRVFVGLAEQSVFSATGRVLCFDLVTGRQVWEAETRYPVFSSPSVSGGRVFVGEGFHQDSDCSLYALDAKSGRKLWSFTTGSHLESSPQVAGGRVFFGAGDDGVYCLGVRDGRELWHQGGLHVDISPLLSGGLLYAGSGYGKLEAFALRGESGKFAWRRSVDLPVWGAPVRLGNRIYYGLGNGNFTESARKPAGAVLCLSATTGEKVWRRNLPDGVLGAVVAGRTALFAGCRDGKVYSISPGSGEILWSAACGGGAVVASPLLDFAGSSLLVASTGGILQGLSPSSGRSLWSLSLAKLPGEEEGLQVYSSPSAGGGRLVLGTMSGSLLGFSFSSSD